MGNFKIEFDTRKLEQALKKQQQEAKRQAEKEARIAIAKAIVDKQPIVGDMKMLDKNSEEILKILLKMYEECKCFDIHADYDEIPDGYQNGLTQILDNLKQYGMIFRHIEFLGGGFDFSLSPQALSYFEDKEKALKTEQERQMAQNINIQNLTATGSNINFGTITNSALNAENIVSNHLEKHGWFYGAVVQLLGTATMAAMMG